jgi:hypothetical protein
LKVSGKPSAGRPPAQAPTLAITIPKAKAHRIMRRALGVIGIVLVLGVFGALTWLLVDWRVLAPTSSRGIAHMALVIVALLLTVGVSWSHVSRRLTGQGDIDRVN